MLDLSRIRESRKIKSVSIRKPLSDIISESYELLYKCENEKVRKLIEAHIENVRETPHELTALSNNLHTLTKLVENEGITDNRIEVEGDTDLDIDNEMREITDLEATEPETHETETREEKTETAIGVSDTTVKESKNPKVSREQFKKFAENSKGKVFLKNLQKSTSLTESSKVFNLQESVGLYKAANSMMTQMAIELEHNHSFMETFSACSKVLGRSLSQLLESICQSNPVPASVNETLSKFSSALREDEEIDDFIDWVDEEYPAEDDWADENGEGADAPEINPQQVADDVLSTVPEEEVPEVVNDIVDQVIDDESVDTETPVEEQVEDLTDEEQQDLRKFLCILRGCEEDSEEAQTEPTEEEVDALEERLLTMRSMKECDSGRKSLRTVKKAKPQEE